MLTSGVGFALQQAFFMHPIIIIPPYDSKRGCFEKVKQAHRWEVACSNSQ